MDTSHVGEPGFRLPLHFSFTMKNTNLLKSFAVSEETSMLVPLDTAKIRQCLGLRKQIYLNKY